ncbi:MAG: hypothetical protein ABJH28_16030 [Paraglaciecola sp.]|uniref:hypothetical protein n=1 Tax=Paraglaciecola sp. TaxID=1920173 RepID=UPI003266C34E
MDLVRKTILLYLMSLSLSTHASIDIIRTGHQQFAKDINQEYNFRILEAALKITEPEFGAYKIMVYGDGSIPKKRALNQILKKDGFFNVVLVTTQPEWEEKAIPIRIPIRMGLLSYRLLLVHKDNADKFSQLNTIEALKPISVGLRKSWSTWEVMQEQGFNVVNSYTYNSLFAMLEKKRFDYIPRGVYEVFEEVEFQSQANPNIMIEPHIVMVLPTPYYAFVSPHAPRIAKRLNAGLEMMMEKGIIRDMLELHYGYAIEQAKVNSRTVIQVENKTLSDETPLDKKHYWLDLFSESSNL